MITIIITAYNVSDTIAKAIQSCLDQTYNDLEILVINDCSSDNTLQVIQSIKDNRIRIINNAQNVGAGMSRRIGTKESKGEYTIFLDGDDYIDKEYIETLYNLAKKYNADVVSSSLKYVDGTITTILEHSGENVMSGIDFVHKTTKSNHKLNCYLNTKLIRRSIWDTVEYSGRRYIEDTQTCYYVLCNTKVLVTTKYCGYNYVQNPQSLCHKSNAIKDTIYRALCAKDILEFVDKYKKEDYKYALKAFMERIYEIKNIQFTNEIRSKYSDELTELFIFLLQFIQF